MSKKKIKISKLAVFNIYGNQNINYLFENVENINNDIDVLKYNMSEKIPIDLNRFESRLEDKIEDRISNIYKELKNIKTSTPKEVIEFNVNKDITRIDNQIQSINLKVNTIEQKYSILTGNSNLSVTDDRLKEYIKKLANLCQEQKTVIEQQDKKIKTLEDKINVQSLDFEKQNDFLAQLLNKVESIEKSVSDDKKTSNKSQANLIDKQSKEIRSLSNTVNKQNEIINSLLNRLEKLENSKKESQVDTQSLKETNFDFPILLDNIDLICIDENSSESKIEKYLNKVIDISKIEDFLRKDVLETSYQNTYLKIFTKYKKDLTNEIKKIDIENLEDEEKSEAIISIIGNSVKNTITSKVIPAISDRIANNYSEYIEFLYIINDYLSSIGFYNEKIEVNDLITNGNNSIHMDTSYIKTTNRKLHGVIAEIKVLPYLINYIDEDNNKTAFVCKGSCSAYRYE